MMPRESSKREHAPARRGWQRNELLFAFNLYCKTPFGRMHRNNEDIILLASLIKRTPSAVAMKLGNFASFDPAHQQRNVTGLKNASRNDKLIYEKFCSDWEGLAYESELARERLDHIGGMSPAVIAEVELPDRPTERTQLIRVRTVQAFFRNAVLASYESRCAMCAISVSSLLNASHIIPWNKEVRRRADPTNGIALCVLHDRAFDRGLMTLDADFKIMVSQSLHKKNASETHRVALIDIAGKMIQLPHRFHPDREAMHYHRTNIFLDAV
jgi:putative restriction endonuclease